MSNRDAVTLLARSRIDNNIAIKIPTRTELQQSLFRFSRDKFPQNMKFHVSEAVKEILKEAGDTAKHFGREKTTGADLMYVMYNDQRGEERLFFLRDQIDNGLALKFLGDLGREFQADEGVEHPGSSEILETDIGQLKDAAEAQKNSFMVVRGGMVDLADSSSSPEELESRKGAAKRAADDLLAQCRKGNQQHAALADLIERYRADLDQMPERLPALVWFVGAQKIELYRTNYGAATARHPGEYPPIEPDLLTAIDAVVICTGSLVLLFPEIAKSQNDYMTYAGGQVRVNRADRALLDRALSTLASSDKALTPRARELAKSVKELDTSNTSPEAPEAARAMATKVGVIRSFLGAAAKVTQAQLGHMRENIRTKGAYDIGKELAKGLLKAGFGSLLDLMHSGAPVFLSLAEVWPTLFEFTKALLRLLGMSQDKPPTDV